jgi:hypothetical protein
MADIIQFPGAINHQTIKKLANDVIALCEKKEKEKLQEESNKA